MGSFNFFLTGGQLRCRYHWLRLWLALFNPSGLTLTTTQIEQAGPTDFTHTNDLNFINVGRQQWEDTLNPNAVRYFAYGECFTTAAWVPALNNRAREDLDTLFVSFADFNVNVHRITRPECGQLCATLRVVCLY